jgi:hypothetical protein
VDGYSTRVTGSASLDDARGAWVAVLADPVQPDPLAHLAALHRQSPGALLVCADAGHGAVLPRAVATGTVPPDRVVGAAPTAIASAARALFALDADVSPSSIQVGVREGAPATCCIDWSRTSIDGVAAETSLHREPQRRLDERLAALWPPGPLTLGAAAARVAEAAWFGSRMPFPCWWITDGGVGAPAVQVLRFAPGGRARVVTSPESGAARAASGAGR